MDDETKLKHELNYLFQVRDEYLWRHKTDGRDFESMRDQFIKKWSAQKPKILFTEFGCSSPISFLTPVGVKRMEPGKSYDENLNEIKVGDNENKTN